MDAVTTLTSARPAQEVGNESTPVRSASLDPAIFVGSWTSTNPHTQGIARVVVRQDGAQLLVRVFGADTPSPCDWGEVPARVYADGPRSIAARAFSATFDLGFRQTTLQAKIKKGVLVVANFNRYSDDSGRSGGQSTSGSACAA